MPKPCYVGLDVGLTRVKAAAFDDAGHQLACIGLATPRAVVSAIVHEIDMDALARAVRLILRDVEGRVRAQGYATAGLGVTGHGNGLYAVDERLRPLVPGIASSDSRARRYIGQLSPAVESEIHSVTGSRPWAGQPVPLLRWLADERPEVFAKVRWALCCKDWIVASLTGSVSADYSDASACGVLDLASRQHSRLPFRALGLPDDAIGLFPAPRASADIVGTLTSEVSVFTGLSPGLPVIAGCMDCVASALGAGAERPGDVTVIAGTWAINSVVGLASGPPPDVTLSALLPDPSLMLCMEVSPASASNLDWLSSALGGPNEPVPVDVLLEEAARTPAGADGLIFLPFVNGTGTTVPASGCFVGASAFHGRGHLARAVLEGVAHMHRMQLQRVQATGLVTAGKPWRLAGGGVNSGLWAQIFADVTRQALHRHQERELGALGVASLVAQAVNRAEQAPLAGRAEAGTVKPGPESEFYRRHAEVFGSVMSAMEPVWTALAWAPRSGGGRAEFDHTRENERNRP